MKKIAYLLTLTFALQAFGDSDVEAQDLREAPAGATDLVPQPSPSGDANDAGTLSVTLDIVFPAEYTRCFLPQPKPVLFRPAARLSLPAMSVPKFDESLTDSLLDFIEPVK